MDLTEALYTTRAMRRVKPDPIPEKAVQAMIDAAIRAPSGGNSQNWRFIIVTDPDTKAALGNLYREGWEILQETVYKRAFERARALNNNDALAIQSSSAWLAENFEAVPLWVFVFSRNDETGASVYPGVWNMMLAARGLGIGTCLTTIAGYYRGDQVFEILGVPSGRGWVNNAAVSAGYPAGRWGTATRRPAHTVAFAEKWGTRPSWSVDEPLWLEPENYGRE
jgi:nitroreductase